MGVLVSGLPTRRRFLAAGATTAAALLAAMPGPAGAAGIPALSSAQAGGGCCPRRIPVPRAVRAVSLLDAAAGNQQAVTVARASRYIMRAHEAALAVAFGLPDAGIRAATLELLANPAPLYQARSPAPADKEAVRQELLAAGLIPKRTTVEGIFPPVADPLVAPQPFWSAPGSSYGAHHAYPGGLVIHEWANAVMAGHTVDTYELVYGVVSDPPALDPVIAVGATLWHDIHKVVVFQWRADGSELTEQVIADTGAHHTLSAAEAIVRGMSPAWVVAQLSAHDPPTTLNVRPDETGLYRHVNYVHAAAIIARVDPVAAGLLRRTADGRLTLAQDPIPMEGYPVYLPDQDYLLTNHAIQVTIRALREVAQDYGIDPAKQEARFNLFRNLVFSQLPDLRLYALLQTGGAAAINARIDREVDLSQLRQ